MWPNTYRARALAAAGSGACTSVRVASTTTLQNNRVSLMAEWLGLEDAAAETRFPPVFFWVFDTLARCWCEGRRAAPAAAAAVAAASRCWKSDRSCGSTCAWAMARCHLW